MPAEFRVFLYDQAMTREQLLQITSLQVDLALDMSSEGEVNLQPGANETGEWSLLDEEWLQVMNRLRIEVKPANDDEFVALIDGPIVSHRIEMHAVPNRSTMTLVVHDDSTLMNRDDRVELFEDMSPSDIASQLFSEFGMEARVDDVPTPHTLLERYVVQRGSAAAFLRKLAKRHGMYFYVRPADNPGSSIGYFRQPGSWVEAPELLLMGRSRNINSFTLEHDALRPVQSSAASVDLDSREPVTAEADTPSIEALGESSAHSGTQPGRLMLSPGLPEQGDLDEATRAVTDHSSWAFRATAEVSAETYPAIILPHHTVPVAGPGSIYGGRYLVSRVIHRLDDSRYTQQLTLNRNATSGGGNSALPSVPGVF